MSYEIPVIQVSVQIEQNLAQSRSYYNNFIVNTLRLNSNIYIKTNSNSTPYYTMEYKRIVSYKEREASESTQNYYCPSNFDFKTYNQISMP